MAWSVLQSASGSSATLTATATLSTNLSSGSKLIAYAVNASAMTISSVKDTAGNSFSQVATRVNGTAAQSYLYVLDTPAGDVGGTTVITATWTGTANGAALIVQEVSGLATGSTAAAVLDGTAGETSGGPTAFAAGGTSVSLGSYTSAASNEFLVIFFADDGDTNGSTGTTPSGYTADAHNVSSNSDSDARVYYKNSTGGAESPSSITCANTAGNTFNWETIFVAFKLPGGAVIRPSRGQPVQARLPLHMQNSYHRGHFQVRIKPAGYVSGINAGTAAFFAARGCKGCYGAPLNNPNPGPKFIQSPGPARARLPLNSQRGLGISPGWVTMRQKAAGYVSGINAGVAAGFAARGVMASYGAPVANPVSGPVFQPKNYPVKSAQKLFPVSDQQGLIYSLAPRGPPGILTASSWSSGRISASGGAQLISGVSSGPPFRQATQPIRARIIANFPRAGIIATELAPGTGNIAGAVQGAGFGSAQGASGAPVQNPSQGPVFRRATRAIQACTPRTSPRGRTGSNPGAPVVIPAVVVPVQRSSVRGQFIRPARGTCRAIRFFPLPQNPSAGPAFRQAVSPVRAQVPQNAPRGRVYSNPGGPVQNPAAGNGPPVYPRTTARAQLPAILAGRVEARSGPAPVNPSQGPAFIQAPKPARAPVPQVFSKGRISSNPGAPVSNPNPGPRFTQVVQPIRARIPQNAPRGRVASNPGAPVFIPVQGSAFRQAVHPAQARIPQNAPRGRVYSNPGAPVHNPVQGPAFRQATSPVKARQPLPPRGRTGSNPGAPVFISVQGPAFRQATQPIHSRISQNAPRGRVYPNAGAPVHNPSQGPQFRQAPQAIRARQPLPARGRVWSNPGTPVVVTITPALFTQATQAIRARLPVPLLKGRVSSNPGTFTPHPGPVFRQAVHPVQARIPQTWSKGRVYSNPGQVFPHPGPMFQQAVHPVRARQPLPPKGRISSNPGASVRNPAKGPVFRQAIRPIRAVIPQNAPRGRVSGNPGGPVQNIPVHRARVSLGLPYTRWIAGQPYTRWETRIPDG